MTPPSARPFGAGRTTYRSFAARIESAHAVRTGWPSWLTDEAVVCRCEEVTYGKLCSTAEATDNSGLRSLKLSTRVGHDTAIRRARRRALYS